jgi:hypothetical protein
MTDSEVLQSLRRALHCSCNKRRVVRPKPEGNEGAAIAEKRLAWPRARRWRSDRARRRALLPVRSPAIMLAFRLDLTDSFFHASNPRLLPR